jgi:hypothetical protein
MKKSGLTLLIIGLAFVLFTGFNLVTREKVVDIGSLEITTKRNHSMSWSPLAGAVIVCVGAGLYMVGRKNTTSA